MLGITTLLFAITTIYLGIYSYGNPDPEHCFYIFRLDTTGVSKAAATTLAVERDIEIREGYPMDVAHLFRGWFMWGFWGAIFQISVLAIFLPFAFMVKDKNSSASVLRTTGIIMQYLSFANGFIWLLLGFFWRFSDAGRTASGEKLERLENINDNAW